MGGNNPHVEVQQLLRGLPGVDEVLGSRTMQERGGDLSAGLAAFHVRAAIEELRRSILTSGPAPALEDLHSEAVAKKALGRWRQQGTALPRVINGTGVILHSGIGRAPLAPAAVAALARAGGYSLLEVEPQEGRRYARDSRAGQLLQALTGAEASLVVNNNAAATLLMLTALANGKEVICSRGEMVEIGGSFRIPDVMRQSGARLVAVGCTNRTHTSDYAAAIGPETGALLVVHTSNYRIMGFCHTPPLEEIVALGRAHGLPVIHDLGSGSLLRPEELGQGDEPPVSASLKAGVDVVSMSGDKLLGGPQAGIILGQQSAVERMRRHPLQRALRVGKLTLAALEATLQLFLDRQDLEETHPVTRMLKASPESLKLRAEALAQAISAATSPHGTARALPLDSEAGSGALPILQIKSFGVSLETPLPPGPLARALRMGSPSLFTRIVNDCVCIDQRTLFPQDEALIPKLVGAALEEMSKSYP